MTEIDKSAWDDGPWQHEPDEESWSFGDVACRIVRNPHSGTFNGYVAVPPSHPWFGVPYDELPVDANLSFSGSFSESTFATATGEGLWWVGYDLDGIHDFAPGRAAWERKNGIPPMPEFPDCPRSYKTVEYARTETERLAREAVVALRENASRLVAGEVAGTYLSHSGPDPTTATGGN